MMDSRCFALPWSRYLLGEDKQSAASGDGSGSSSVQPKPATTQSLASLARSGATGRLESHKSRLEALQRRKAALQAHLTNDDMFDQLNFDAQRFKTEAIAFEKVRRGKSILLRAGGMCGAAATPRALLGRRHVISSGRVPWCALPAGGGRG